MIHRFKNGISRNDIDRLHPIIRLSGLNAEHIYLAANSRNEWTAVPLSSIVF